MKTTRMASRQLWSIVVVSFVLLASRSPAQPSGGNPRADPNRFALNARLGFNIKANFSDVGLSLNPGSPAGSGENRTYLDGSVLVDRSGNQGGLTWNWGFRDPGTQVPGNDTMLMHNVTAFPANGVSRANTDDPQYGFELSYGRVLATIGRCNVGLEFAFGFSDISIQDHRTLSGSVARLTDTYPLNGVVPLSTGYQGTFNGPGPLLSDSPVISGASTRQTDLVAGSTTGSRKVDASLYGFRLGPFLEVPVVEKLTASISGGLSWAYLESDFRYAETAMITGVSPYRRAGSNSASDWLVGGYAAAALHYAVSERVSISTGVQYQDLGTFSQQAAGKKAELDLRSSVFWTIGFGVNF